MTGPSEGAFLATLGLSTAVTFGVLWLWMRPRDRDPGVASPEVPLGPAVTVGGVGVTILAMLTGCALVLGSAWALHGVLGDGILWFIAVTLVPVSLGPTIWAATWAMDRAARGALWIDGDALVATWDGDERRWHLPGCVAMLRLVPSNTPGAEAALLVLIDGPEGALPLVVPLTGIPGMRWLSDLGLPDGWWEVPQGAVAFPVSPDVRRSRRLFERVFERVAGVDRG